MLHLNNGDISVNPIYSPRHSLSHLLSCEPSGTGIISMNIMNQSGSNDKSKSNKLNPVLPGIPEVDKGLGSSSSVSGVVAVVEALLTIQNSSNTPYQNNDISNMMYDLQNSNMNNLDNSSMSSISSSRDGLVDSSFDKTPRVATKSRARHTPNHTPRQKAISKPNTPRQMQLQNPKNGQENDSSDDKSIDDPEAEEHNKSNSNVNDFYDLKATADAKERRRVRNMELARMARLKKKEEREDLLYQLDVLRDENKHLKELANNRNIACVLYSNSLSLSTESNEMEEIIAKIIEIDEVGLEITKMNNFCIVNCMNTDFPIVFASSNFLSMLGCESNDVLGHNFRLSHGPQVDLVEVDKLKNSLLNMEECDVQLFNFQKNGTKFVSKIRLTYLSHGKNVKLCIAYYEKVEFEFKELPTPISINIPTSSRTTISNAILNISSQPSATKQKRGNTPTASSNTSKPFSSSPRKSVVKPAVKPPKHLALEPLNVGALHNTNSLNTSSTHFSDGMNLLATASGEIESTSLGNSSHNSNRKRTINHIDQADAELMLFNHKLPSPDNYSASSAATTLSGITTIDGNRIIKTNQKSVSIVENIIVDQTDEESIKFMITK
eukprot:gene10587-14224_t